MKNLYLLLVAVFVVSIISSCGSSPYKKRKNCKGNGSWSGHRNLGYTNPFPKAKESKQTYYVRTSKDETLQDM